MSIFFSGSEARLGSLGIVSLIPCPPLPNIIAEWAAILPLVCHLASQRDDYVTTGEIALLGKLNVGLFPRLGTLSGLARLLGRGTKFLDYASARGGSSCTVWDIKWGNVFPCANGAARAAISGYLMNRDRPPLQRMPETLTRQPQGNNSKRSPRQNSSTTKSTHNLTQDEKSNLTIEVRHAEEELIRRYQILHVYRFHRKQRRKTLRCRLNQLRLSKLCYILWFAMLICVAIWLGLFGAYGTAAIIVCTSVSGLVALSVSIRRPSGYLRNNETHDPFMLSASHGNATEWHLYIGDRAIVDTLLNKPMFVVPEGQLAHLVARWFRFAHLLQLAAMTFVAAQKAWDGVCLVVLLAIHWAFHWSLRGKTVACDWLEREGVEAEVKSFEFGGRSAMLGAIQIFSRSDITSWMDKIMVPHPRRDAWLKRLQGEETTDDFDTHDARWIEFASEASLASAEVLERVFNIGGKRNASA